MVFVTTPGKRAGLVRVTTRGGSCAGPVKKRLLVLAAGWSALYYSASYSATQPGAIAPAIIAAVGLPWPESPDRGFGLLFVDEYLKSAAYTVALTGKSLLRISQPTNYSPLGLIPECRRIVT